MSQQKTPPRRPNGLFEWAFLLLGLWSALNVLSQLFAGSRGRISWLDLLIAGAAVYWFGVHRGWLQDIKILSTDTSPEHEELTTAHKTAAHVSIEGKMTKATRWQVLWRCSNCNLSQLPALTHRLCPSCGHPQRAQDRYYPGKADPLFPVADDYKFTGPDLECPKCQMANPDTADLCAYCGTNLENAQQVTVLGHLSYSESASLNRILADFTSEFVIGARKGFLEGVSEKNVKKRLMISYSHQNRREVEIIEKALLKAGYIIWRDDQLTPGTDWFQAILEEIDQANRLLLMLSPDSIASKYVAYERQFGELKAKIEGKKNFIIPIMVEECNKQLPDWTWLRDTQILKWYEDKATESLIKAIGIRSPNQALRFIRKLLFEIISFVVIIAIVMVLISRDLGVFNILFDILRFLVDLFR